MLLAQEFPKDLQCTLKVCFCACYIALIFQHNAKTVDNTCDVRMFRTEGCLINFQSPPKVTPGSFQLTLIFHKETKVANVHCYFRVIRSISQLVDRQRTFEESSRALQITLIL